MLLDHARARGAEVREETEVTPLLASPGGAVEGVEVRTKHGAAVDLRAPVIATAG